MRLVISLEDHPLSQQLTLADSVCGIADIIQVTSMTELENGDDIVGILRKQYPHLVIMKNTQIVDNINENIDKACAFYPNIITILSSAGDDNIQLALKLAHQRRVQLMVELNEDDWNKRCDKLDQMGVDYISLDYKKDNLNQIQAIKENLKRASLACKGVITISDIKDLYLAKVDLIIVAKEITTKPDPRLSAMTYQMNIGRYDN